MYVYIESESNQFAVGFYDPSGNWHPESNCNTKSEAAKRVNYLNGGHKEPEKIIYKSREEQEEEIMSLLKKLHPLARKAFYFYLLYLSMPENNKF